MSVLMIGPDEQQAIAALMKRAEENALSYQQLLQASQQKAPLPIFFEQTIEIPMSYTVTFSIEEHRPGIRCRHLSMSTSTKDRMPSPAAVEMMLKEFGFERPLVECLVYPEDTTDGRKAVNVIEELTGQTAQLS